MVLIRLMASLSVGDCGACIVGFVTLLLIPALDVEADDEDYEAKPGAFACYMSYSGRAGTMSAVAC